MKLKNRTSVTSIILLAVIGIATGVFLDRGSVRSSSASSSSVLPIELVLMVDTSGSVNNAEYDLQRDGYAQAFRSPQFGQFVQSLGGIAVVYIEWSNASHQSIRVPWTRLNTAADCVSYGNSIASLSRTHSGGTDLAPALIFARRR